MTDLRSEYATLTPEQVLAIRNIKSAASVLASCVSQARNAVGGHADMFIVGDQRLQEAVMWFTKALT